MNLLQKAMRLKALRLKARLQPQVARRSKAQSATHIPAQCKPGANPISPRLFITAGVCFVLGMAAIGILIEPAKKIPSPVLPVQGAATPAYSSQLPLVATNRGKTVESRQEVAALVSDWANAWAAKDADHYLSFYAPEFLPPHGLTRSAWEKLRRSRLSKYRKIEIALSELTVSLEDNTAAVEFIQAFNADGFSETGLHKRLDLILQDARWMIVKETSQ